MQNPHHPSVSQDHIGTTQSLLNATSILVPGIISIPTCFCYFTYGLVASLAELFQLFLPITLTNSIRRTQEVLNGIYLLAILFLGTYFVCFLEEK